jgi:hypothetical protein
MSACRKNRKNGAALVAQGVKRYETNARSRLRR